MLGALVGVCTLAMAADNKKSAPAPAPAPSRQAPAAAARPAAPAARPAGNPGGGTTYRPNTGGQPGYRPAPSGPSANRPTTSAPVVNRPTTSAPGVHGPAAGITSPSRGASSTFHSAAPKGSTERVTPTGSAVRTRPNGKVSDVHDARTGTDVHHGLNGNSRVSVERADHSRVVSERGRPGYVQRQFSHGGHDFARRSYFYHGRAYDRFYRGYGFRGAYLNVYAPGFYYGPGFYGWAYNPWGMSIGYGWGWGGSPWFGYYGGYFSPYATYPSAAYWLTDYMIGNDLQAAYAAHQDAGEADGAPGAPGGPAELTPDVKQQIADEVRNQLALENQEAQQNAQQHDIDAGSSGIARMLGDGRPHVFVAGGALDLVDANGQECGISDGDVLGLQGPSAPDATAASLVVLASKGGQECLKGATVSVQLADLQEMQNHMRETIDQGLQDLRAKQGTGGLPAAPPSAQAPTTSAGFAAIAPPPDPNAATEIQQAGQQGGQAEQTVTAEAPAQ